MNIGRKYFGWHENVDCGSMGIHEELRRCVAALCQAYDRGRGERGIRNEEQVLEEGLLGYREYQAKVKYRLIPFVW